MASKPKKTDEASTRVSTVKGEEAAGKGLGTTGRGRSRSVSPAEDQAPVRTVTPSRRRPAVVIGVVIASIIMVGSILLPSLSAIISGIQKSKASATTATTAAATSAAATDASTSDAETTNTYMNDLDEHYQSIVSPLEEKLKDSPDDKAALINLANNYLNWGSTARNYASSDDDQAHIRELLTTAEGYYDSYLELEDASAARVNRALCQYYLGDQSGAIKAIEDFTKSVGDYAPAWTNLGMMYQETGETEKATDAFNKALEVDPDNTYGLQSYATSQLRSLTSAATTSAAE